MIVVDAGHGGMDPGASGNNIVEKDYNLMISKYIYDRFNELGIPATLTRSTDETLTPEERVQRILNAYGNRPDVLVLSNHLNAGGGNGAEFIYALRNNDTLSRIFAEEIAKAGQNVRKWYQRRLPSDTSKDYYFIHRNTGVTEPVLIEYGFVDNALDAEQIKNNWRDFAEAIVRGVTIYKEFPYDKEIAGDIHIVQKGESLWSIAKKYNVGVDELKQVNNLTSNTLSIGQRLKIPGFAPPEQTETTYVVQPGDSLYSIGSAYNVSVEELKEVNNLVSNTLSIGQVLKIPDVGIIVEPEPEEPLPEEIEPTLPPTTEPLTYTVQRGDSLYSIAQEYGVTVSEIRNLNNLTTDLLNIGQVLLIPVTEYPEQPTPLPTEPISYTVKSGDSLYSIAQEYGVTVSEIKTLNNLTTNLLNIGQQLLIPAVEAPIPAPSTITYTVQRGDSLYSIANRFDTTVSAIKELNNLTSGLLSIGQQLLIPVQTTGGVITYTVQQGDSLYSIANRFGVTVSQLREINNLTSDLLSIGQQLLIPNQTRDFSYNRQEEPIIPIVPQEPPMVPPGGPTEEQIVVTPPMILQYSVQRGDTLYSIANRYGTTTDAIRRANNLQTDVLRVGQKLIVPMTTEELPLPLQPNVTIYTVQRGDTLWSIARRYGTTASQIRLLNQLPDNIIRISEELLVPVTGPYEPLPDTVAYIVREGDTLYSIANRYGTTVDAIRQLNNLQTDSLRIGQILSIPS